MPGTIGKRCNSQSVNGVRVHFFPAAFQPHQTLRRGLAGVSPVAVDVQDDVRGADGHGHLVPLVVGQAVGEHLGVGLLASGAVVEAHLAALAAALQLQEPGGKGRVLFPHPDR